MIKFKCLKCGEGLEAPESLANQSLQCPKCKRYVKVPRRKSKKAEDVSRKAGKIAGNVLIRFWENTPSPFRNAFLATLGVVAALLIAFYIYRVPRIFRSAESQHPVYTQTQPSRPPPPRRTVPTPPVIMTPPSRMPAVQNIDYDKMATLLKLRESCQSLHLIQIVRVTAAKRYVSNLNDNSFINVLRCSSKILKDLYETVNGLKIHSNPDLELLHNDVLSAIDAEYAFQQSIIEFHRKPMSLRRQTDIESKSKESIDLYNRAMMSVIATLFDGYEELSRAFVRVENTETDEP